MKFLIILIDDTIIDMTDVDNSATEELLGGARKRVHGRRQERSDSEGGRASRWEALSTCLRISQILTNIMLCGDQW